MRVSVAERRGASGECKRTLYSLFLMVWRRVLVMSTGIETAVETNPETKEAKE
jgi:hypothetical protein